MRYIEPLESIGFIKKEGSRILIRSDGNRFLEDICDPIDEAFKDKDKMTGVVECYEDMKMDCPETLSVYMEAGCRFYNEVSPQRRVARGEGKFTRTARDGKVEEEDSNVVYCEEVVPEETRFESVADMRSFLEKDGRSISSDDNGVLKYLVPVSSK